jgi:hypothetical protein
MRHEIDLLLLELWHLTPLALPDSETQCCCTQLNPASVCLSACLPACLPVCLPACLPVCLSVCLSACLPVCLSACLPVCLSACLPVCLSVSLSVCLSVCLSVRLSVCLADASRDRPAAAGVVARHALPLLHQGAGVKAWWCVCVLCVCCTERPDVPVQGQPGAPAGHQTDRGQQERHTGLFWGGVEGREGEGGFTTSGGGVCVWWGGGGVAGGWWLHACDCWAVGGLVWCTPT